MQWTPLNHGKVTDPEELLLDISALEAWREKIENRSKDTAKNRKSVVLQN